MAVAWIYTGSINRTIENMRKMGIKPNQAVMFNSLDKLKGHVRGNDKARPVIFIDGEALPMWLYEEAALKGICLHRLDKDVFRALEVTGFKIIKPGVKKDES